MFHFDNDDTPIEFIEHVSNEPEISPTTLTVRDETAEEAAARATELNAAALALVSKTLHTKLRYTLLCRGFGLGFENFTY